MNCSSVVRGDGETFASFWPLATSSSISPDFSGEVDTPFHGSLVRIGGFSFLSDFGGAASNGEAISARANAEENVTRIGGLQKRGKLLPSAYLVRAGNR